MSAITVTRAVRVSPYKGLAAYSAEDSSFFFGRERTAEILIANLRAHRLTVLYGESGVGKSSLLQAGVLSELRGRARDDLHERETPEFMPVYFSSWRDDPVSGLVGSVRSAVANVLPQRTLTEPSSEHVADTLAEWARELECEFLFILDQFEEYFLYHGRGDGEGTFALEFARMLNRPGLPASFLLSIREDAFAKLDRFKVRVPGLLDNYLRIRHLDRRCAREAIERPLEAWNTSADDAERVEIDDALAEAIINEVKAGSHVAEQAGQGVIERDGDITDEERVEAPYLQLVLTRLWDEEAKESSRRLRPETLRRLGGAKHIVQNHLDAAMSALPPDEQELAAAAFYYLVTPEGTKIAQSVQTLAVYSDRPANELEPVLEKLATGDVRILRPVAPPPGTTGGTRYEIYHDVLGSAILDWRARTERVDLERKREEAERGREQAEGRMRRSLLLAVAFAAFALSLALYVTDALDSLELRTVDARFSVRGTSSVPRDMMVVGIDDRTLRDLRINWPFPRSLHGRLIDRLRRDGARLIVYDVEFFGRSREAQDLALFEALRRARARPVILAATATNERGEPNLLGADVNDLVGLTNALPASALNPGPGTVRKLPYFANGLKSIGVVAAETLIRRPIDPPELGGDTMWIDYAGPPGSIPAVSFSRVLRGQFRRGLFRRKIVVIGASAPSLKDRHSTSIDDDMAGPEIQANAVNTVRHRAPLRSAGTRSTALLILLFSLLAPLVTFRARSFIAVGIALIALLLYLVAVQIAFNNEQILPLIYPALALIVAAVGTIVVESLTAHPAPRQPSPTSSV